MMVYLSYILIYILFMFSLISYIINRKHLLSMLLSLENIVLVLFLFLMFFLYSMNFELFFSMMFLTFSVCEGALGLSILVSMIRTHGNDYFQSFSILMC